MAALDFFVFIAFVVVSVSIGRPVSYLNCYHRFDNLNGDVLENLRANWDKVGSTLSLGFWSGMSKSNCMETKAIWGFCIALT
jgi:hypothetical protein